MRSTFFSLFFLFSFLNASANEEKDLVTSLKFKDGNSIVKIWDSISTNDQNYFELLRDELWIPPLEFYYELAKKQNDTHLKLNLSYILGYVYHTTTRFEQAIPLFKLVVKNKKYIGEFKYQISLLKLEESYIRIGQLKPAIDIRKRRIDENFANSYWDIYEEAGLFDDAIKEFLRTSVVKDKNDWEAIFYYSQLAQLYFENQQWDSAELNYKKAYDACEHIIVNENYTGKTYYSEYVKRYYRTFMMGGIAEIYMQRGNYSEAIPLLKEDIHQSKLIKEVGNAILKRLDLAECFMKLSDFPTAKAYIDTSETLMKSIKLYHYDFRITKLKADYFLETKRFDSSTFYFNRYIVLRDTLENRNRKNKSIALVFINDTEKQKETVALQELELQKAKTREAEQKLRQNILFAGIIILVIVVSIIFWNNRQKTKRKKEIEKSLREKEILLKEIHHRVKNNLTTLKSLFYLQAKSSDKEEVKLALEECQLRIQSMAFIHQSLYEESENEKIELEHFLQQLFNELELSIRPAGKQIEIELIGVEIELEMSIALFLGLIINELATNSYKYAFENKDTGIIKIELIKSEGQLFIRYMDNGKGLKDGFNASSGGFGFRLMSILTDQINGAIEYTKNENSSEFTLKIPLEK